MAKIEGVKSYTGCDLEKVFFRPMLNGQNAEELGIRVMYNMPVPTTLHFWKRYGDILRKYKSSGWEGNIPADKYQKTINLSRVKAEIGYSADDYFSKVFEKITNRPEINMDDLSGTELEEAETTLFKESIAESIRATMWMGRTTRDEYYNTFDGLATRIIDDSKNVSSGIPNSTYSDVDADSVQDLFKSVWERGEYELRAAKSQGNLAYFVTSDVYNAYEEYLDSAPNDIAYMARQEGRNSISFRGIPVIDLNLGQYLMLVDDLPESFVILADRRNLALAVNTSDFPGTEVRMWYNPDMMENRQRAVFMAGTDYLLPELISVSYRA